MSFTHLHVHTEFSLLDGSGKIKEMAAQAKKLGMDALAITDHGVMYGVIDFYRACLAEGIKPIIGCEVYVAPNSRFDKEGSASEERYHHLVLLAENDIGYHNLIKIVSRGFTEGFYYKPRVDHELLKEYSEGIIALSACLAGEVAVMLRRNFFEEAKASALKLQEIFGAGNFFLELQDHGYPEQKSVNQGLLRISEETNIPLVATNDIHYTYDTDETAHDILLCIQTQKKVTDEDRMRYAGGQFYMKSPEEMRELFPYALQALQNTEEIAKRCNVTIEFGHYKLPKYDVPAPYTVSPGSGSTDDEGDISASQNISTNTDILAREYLRKLCEEGLVRRYKDPSTELWDRLNYELETIENMGFVDYFLIVWDFIKYAKDNDIIVGPGRGSAAGSVVSYCLEITNIDPIKYSLLFERFLNPERLTMPDIDIDFCFERRQEVIDYVVSKYGKDRVVQIVTFGTMAARAVIRDVGRALDMPYASVDVVAKMIPTELGITIEKALNINPDLKKLYESDPEVMHLIDMSKRLEGLPRHTSMHAAGVVISNAPADEYVPLSRSSDDSITTQFTMTTLEELGLLKMDFLGLRTLTVIQNAVLLVNQAKARLGETEENFLNIDEIDYNDSKVLDLISSAKTEGIFQLESSGMKSFMKELKPQNLEDIIAGISLYRPGPMDFIPKYIQGKNNQKSIQYECKELEPILSPTYGCIVYQEQVMQIVRELAGYSFGRSDLVRRAMSKKKASVMEKERQSFVYGNVEEGVPGCISKGIPEAVANHIYDEMTDFAKYAFNKSHAAAYAVVSYQTAYLKCYYPVEFMAALMTSVIDNPSKVAEYIYTCRQMGIKLLPPDINDGYATFTVSGENIRYGLSAIKGLGRPVIDALVIEREENGPYLNLKDFASRLSGKEVNKRTIESFIKSGAFDSMPGTRKQLMHVYVGVLDGVSQEKKRAMTGQMSLFDLDGDAKVMNEEIIFPEVGEYSKEELLAFEKEVLGIYVSGHPLEAYELLLKRNATANTADFIVEEETNTVKVADGDTVTVGGMITSRTLKTTRTNAVMAFITLEDMFGTMEVIIFPRDYEKFKYTLEIDNRVFIKGKVAVEEDKPAKLICQSITPFADISKELWVKFSDKEAFLNNEKALYEIIKNYDGNDRITVYCEKEKAIKKLPLSQSVIIEEGLLENLRNAFSEENIKVVEKL
ncbi:DNA polymerase III subunit alpha [Lachnoclostridium phytofermentans]|uniref:DNA polymerase III subunit alpha n=1 Tax=Lachnoclostridium phytofermentans (strain ATCC 700394 / DSM 18823 / ISDg) TaxID=357809 RepID=A9KSS8_LACP7|nr:DNA polymerase III subunit alpha [Lachnoclostridium phytofermentans]ABX40722.1 DNA polymerase III, alpha subunit [Lachnoclostridium phytofermentans ISDg]